MNINDSVKCKKEGYDIDKGIIKEFKKVNWIEGTYTLCRIESDGVSSWVNKRYLEKV